MAEKLTDRTAKTSNFADGDLVHVVDVSDTSQDPAGSSFKSTIGNIYGSYLAPKITSAQIVTNAADTYSVTLADTVSSNHYLFLQTASGDPFVDVTINSYSNPKDGAIVVIRLNRGGTDDLIILGGGIAGNGWDAGVYTFRYSTSVGSWVSVNYIPIDNAGIPLTGTTVGNPVTGDVEFDATSGILLDNSSRLREGTTDAGTGGNKGIAQICAVGYELKWEAGSQYVMDGNGLLIREVNHKFNTAPTVTNDDTEGFYVGSRWVLDDGTIYTCTDDSTGAAVWDVQFPVIEIKKTLTPSEIKNMNTTGVSIGLPSSGVGYYYRTLEFNAKLTFNTTPYESSQIYISSNVAGGGFITYCHRIISGFLNSSTDAFNYGVPVNNSDSKLAENDGLSIFADGDSVDGDSTVDCYISVQKVKL